MRPLLRRTCPTLTPADRERLDLRRGDDLLSELPLPALQSRLVVTTWHLVLLPDAGTPVLRPWHLVDGAGWSRDDSTLRVSWVDGDEPWRLAVAEPDARALQALRERVQASVVAHDDTAAGGGRVRVVIRQDLATRELLVQTLYAGGARPDDPAVRAAREQMAARLRDAVGLPPQPGGSPGA